MKETNAKSEPEIEIYMKKASKCPCRPVATHLPPPMTRLSPSLLAYSPSRGLKYPAPLLALLLLLFRLVPSGLLPRRDSQGRAVRPSDLLDPLRLARHVCSNHKCTTFRYRPLVERLAPLRDLSSDTLTAAGRRRGRQERMRRGRRERDRGRVPGSDGGGLEMSGRGRIGKEDAGDVDGRPI